MADRTVPPRPGQAPSSSYSPPCPADSAANPMDAADAATPWSEPAIPSPASSVKDNRDAYLSAPPGQATRAFMTTAGIYAARRNKRIFAVTAGVILVSLAGLVIADLLGAIKIPGMGLVYDVTGLVDPNIDRAVERVKSKLTDSSISPKERQALRQRLLGLNVRAKQQQPRAATATPEQDQTAKSVKVEDKQATPSTHTEAERALIADVFGDTRKKETEVKLVDRQQIVAHNLPDGLTRDVIYEVIDKNKRSMSLCIAEALRKGERLNGRMEVTLTINAQGRVSSAEVNTPRFAKTAMAKCTVRRARGWRFPPFKGDPVTVAFPYVLSVGF